MILTIESLVLLCIGFFIIASLYSSVGFGGGSSYLALLTLFFAEFYHIRSIALLCNIIVVSGTTYWYFKEGHVRLKEMVPFVIASIPLAFIGASFRLNEKVFFIVLGGALIVSALFLIGQTYMENKEVEKGNKDQKFVTYLLGGSIGLLSGVVGIGGGIFLAPVLNHIKWNVSIKIAALASFFILVNSISGIGGLVYSNTFQVPWIETIALVLTVFIGGQIGIRISLKRLSANGIKRVTAILVFIVGFRVLLVNGLDIT
ncbi:MAG: sulfite exporter TauE/SafE family protein [Cellulophaga sp.]